MPDRHIVLQIVQHLRPGGLENLALDLVSFAPQPIDVHLLSLEGTAETAIPAWPKLRQYQNRLHFLDKKPGLRPSVIRDILSIANKLGATILHTHHLGPLVYGAPAARLGNLPIVHSEHNSWHLTRWRERLKERLMLAIGKPALVADADLVARDLLRIAPSSNPKTIMNGVDSRRFCPDDQYDARRRLNLPEAPLIIACAARLERVKGHRHLIKALSLLPEHFHLALAGDGSLRETLIKQTQAAGLSQRVHFLGAIDDMPRFYQAASMACLPSLNEGLPLAILEAQACGLPMICSDVGGCGEAICPETGRLVAPGDSHDLAAAILEVAAQGQTISPREFVTRHGDIRVMAARYCQVYQQEAMHHEHR